MSFQCHTNLQAIPSYFIFKSLALVLCFSKGIHESSYTPLSSSIWWGLSPISQRQTPVSPGDLLILALSSKHQPARKTDWISHLWCIYLDLGATRCSLSLHSSSMKTINGVLIWRSEIKIGGRKLWVICGWFGMEEQRQDMDTPLALPYSEGGTESREAEVIWAKQWLWCESVRDVSVSTTEWIWSSLVLNWKRGRWDSMAGGQGTRCKPHLGQLSQTPVLDHVSGPCWLHDQSSAQTSTKARGKGPTFGLYWAFKS